MGHCFVCRLLWFVCSLFSCYLSPLQIILHLVDVFSATVHISTVTTSQRYQHQNHLLITCQHYVSMTQIPHPDDTDRQHGYHVPTMPTPHCNNMNTMSQWHQHYVPTTQTLCPNNANTMSWQLQYYVPITWTLHPDNSDTIPSLPLPL